MSAVTFLVPLLAFMGTGFAVPLSTRENKLSPSFASMTKPILAPYYVYFGNNKTKSLDDAVTSLGMKVVTVGFASAPNGKVSIYFPLPGSSTSDENDAISANLRPTWSRFKKKLLATLTNVSQTPSVISFKFLFTLIQRARSICLLAVTFETKLFRYSIYNKRVRKWMTLLASSRTAWTNFRRTTSNLTLKYMFSSSVIRDVLIQIKPSGSGAGR